MKTFLQQVLAGFLIYAGLLLFVEIDELWAHLVGCWVLMLGVNINIYSLMRSWKVPLS